jgi:hypothetical protein
MAEVLREDLDELAQAGFEQPLVRLLPYFDTFLLGHKDKDHLVVMEHRLSVYRTQGWIAPVVLVNGRVVGVWEHSQERNRLYVKVSKFGPVSQRIIASIREEARELGRFLENPNIDVQIS